MKKQQKYTLQQIYWVAHAFFFELQNLKKNDKLLTNNTNVEFITRSLIKSKVKYISFGSF